MESECFFYFIECALDHCQRIIDNHPNAVLSESDFERLLCKCISESIQEHIEYKPKQGDYSVHTQISHYFPSSGKIKPKDRVDIIVLDETIIENGDKHKGFKYLGPSIALELKYIRNRDSITIVKKDFNKWNDIKQSSSLYVIVLIECKNEMYFKRKKEKFETIADNVKDKTYNRSMLFYKCLKKKII